MPSPIAHSVTGLFIYKLLHDNQGVIWKKPSYVMVLCVFIAVLPDLDFIPQLLTGKKYHHTFTHSIVFAIIVAFVSGMIGWLLRRKFLKVVLLTLLLYFSHLFLDFFTGGGKGLQLFWPFAKTFYISQISIFPGTHYSMGLFNVKHLIFVSFETIYAILLFVILRYCTGTRQL